MTINKHLAHFEYLELFNFEKPKYFDVCWKTLSYWCAEHWSGKFQIFFFFISKKQNLRTENRRMRTNKWVHDIFFRSWLIISFEYTMTLRLNQFPWKIAKSVVTKFKILYLFCMFLSLNFRSCTKRRTSTWS